MGQYVQRNLTGGENVVYETRLHWIVFVSLGAVLTLFIAPLLARASSEFAITSKRVIIKMGALGRRSLEMNIPKIESVVVQQSLLGRILGYGTIVVVGTGGTKEGFQNIASPMEFRRAFQQIAA